MIMYCDIDRKYRRYMIPCALCPVPVLYTDPRLRTMHLALATVALDSRQVTASKGVQGVAPDCLICHSLMPQIKPINDIAN